VWRRTPIDGYLLLLLDGQQPIDTLGVGGGVLKSNIRLLSFFSSQYKFLGV
jgi:hypothetical protein